VGLKPILRTTTSLSALTLSDGSFDPYKPVPDMTYNVFSGTLNPTQSIELPFYPVIIPSALHVPIKLRSCRWLGLPSRQICWNMTSAQSLSTFHQCLKTFLFSTSFPDIILDNS